MPKSYMFLLFFFLYSIALLYFGKSGYKETETISDFFVGGKRLGLLACVSTFVATWFSAASMQGLPGLIYTYGYAFVFYSVIPWFIGAWFLILLAPKLRASGAMTIPEYLNMRYDSKAIQVSGGLLVVMNFILYIVIQIRGFGIVISEFLEIPYTLAILIVYIFVLYTTFGGLFSIARSDSFNMVIICMGVLIAVISILNRVGGIGALFEKARMIEGYAIEGYPYYTPKGSLLHPLAGGNMPLLTLISAFFGWGLGLSTNPQYTTRIIAAKDDKTAVKMIKISIVILSFVYAGLILIGLGSRAIIPMVQGVDSIDAIFPFIFNSLLSSKISGLVFLSIMAAAISTANSQLLVASSSFVYDVFEIVSKKTHTDEMLLGISRFVVFVAGSISLLLALSPPESLLVYGGYIWGMFSVSFLIPLYGGAFWKKATRKGAICSMVSGLAVMIFLIIYNYESQSVFDLHPAMPGVIVSAIVFYVASRLEGAGII
ncbi:MAG: sodium:solute symporter family protein [Peptostreptococcaceae bacterium]|nr:sodium:solute symporter family protein [Peptostreptococcaceae bacterium]